MNYLLKKWRIFKLRFCILLYNISQLTILDYFRFYRTIFSCLLVSLFIGGIGYGIYEEITAAIDRRLELRVLDKAQELAAKITQDEIVYRARRYTDQVLDGPIILPKANESVKGYDKAQLYTNRRKYKEYGLTVEATAYWTHDPEEASGTGIAYDGTPAIAYKTIAVDPSVIPLQAEVYVPTIGWCRANDTGNAINGRIIDIAMPNRAEAWEWGRRLVRVRVRVPYKVRA